MRSLVTAEDEDASPALPPRGVTPSPSTLTAGPFAGTHASGTWVAGMHVLMTRDGGDFTRTTRWGPARFEHAVRKELTRPGKIRP